MMDAGARYSEMMGGVPLEPWFRSAWAADGKTTDGAPQALLEDQRFIEGCRATIRRESR
jgi:hypothetical protein